MKTTQWQPTHENNLIARQMQKQFVESFKEIIPPWADFGEALLTILSHYMQVDPYKVEQVKLDHIE